MYNNYLQSSVTDRLILKFVDKHNYIGGIYK